MPPNISEKRGGQERQRGARDVYGRARDVSFPPIIDEEKGEVWDVNGTIHVVFTPPR
jgi:hypothetical protein